MQQTIQQGVVFYILYLSHTISAVSPACECVVYQSYGGSQGKFISPNFPQIYPRNINCILYTFIGDIGEIIELTFLEFDLDMPSHGKCTDYLRFYLDLDRPEVNERSTWDSERCGNITMLEQKVVYSSGRSLILEFHSDLKPANHTGFRGIFRFLDEKQFMTDCIREIGTTCTYYCQSNNLTKTGKFFSPRYPQNYPPGTSCQYMFRGLPGEKIRVVFQNIQLYHIGGSCENSKDVIVVHDGIDKAGPVKGRYCDVRNQVEIISSTQFLYIDFYTDKRDERQGFAATYEFCSNCYDPMNPPHNPGTDWDYITTESPHPRVTSSVENGVVAKPPGPTVNKRQPTIPLRKTSLLQNRTKPLKRKATQGIEFVTSKQFKLASTTVTVPEVVKSYDVSRLSQESLDFIACNPEECLPDADTTVSPFPTTMPSSLVEVLPPPTTFFDMDLQRVTETPPVPTATITSTPAQHDDGLYRRLDDILSYVRRLEEKIDLLSVSTPAPQPAPRPERREMATQTDPIQSHLIEIPAIIITPPPDESTAPTEVASDASETHEEILMFADKRLLNLRPVDLGGEHLNRQRLEEIVDRCGSIPPATESFIQMDHQQILNLAKHSQGPGHFAKKLIFRHFTIRELYGRNACGRNFLLPGRTRKRAIDSDKLREVLDIVSLHYKEDNVEKKCVTAINAGLRYLWNTRLRFPWLNISDLE